ncbi:hypothetical protein PIB30_022161 [Stylosanthes scabra]|uniref:Uncharacterized protein n=1 Tax=Stylosanthes scabra TaxID=79078 RepID=A0ABU6V843_9FABA|nr:hypothetical protein [Stylosanthes scabra]
MARPYDLRLPISSSLEPSRASTSLMARPHASRARPMALARPRKKLDQLLEGPCARTHLTARPREPIKKRFGPSFMDKKGKAKRLVCKMYASQAAARNEATSKPPTAPKAPEEPKKKPIFIDLTADSESEDTTHASSETHFSSVPSCSEGHSTPR